MKYTHYVISSPGKRSLSTALKGNNVVTVKTRKDSNFINSVIPQPRTCSYFFHLNLGNSPRHRKCPCIFKLKLNASKYNEFEILSAGWHWINENK